MLARMLVYNRPTHFVRFTRTRLHRLRIIWWPQHVMQAAREADLWERSLLPPGRLPDEEDLIAPISKPHTHVTQRESDDWIAALSTAENASAAHGSGPVTCTSSLQAVVEIGSHSTRLLISRGGRDMVSYVAHQGLAQAHDNLVLAPV
jgi:hypothetical protein